MLGEPKIWHQTEFTQDSGHVWRCLSPVHPEGILWIWRVMLWCLLKKSCLVGGPGPPLWRIWKSIGMMIIPNIWENKTWQPNHQPVFHDKSPHDCWWFIPHVKPLGMKLQQPLWDRMGPGGPGWTRSRSIARCIFRIDTSTGFTRWIHNGLVFSDTLGYLS